MSDRKILLIFAGVFLLFWFLPVEDLRFKNALFEAFALTKWYAREHVILCLIPAFFIAGAISVFVSQDSVMKYLGRKANRIVAYGVASVSGAILAVCSCTVLPLFAGIYKRGAGLGPAIAFLYSGPAINVLAIILTARVLGVEIGIARASGSVIFSVVIGIVMALLFKTDDEERLSDTPEMLYEPPKRSLIVNIFYFIALIGILVFLNWGKEEDNIFFSLVYSVKWYLSGFFFVFLCIIIFKWFSKDELLLWIDSSWQYAKMIFPLLFTGVFIAGFLLGRPGNEGVIPSQYVTSLVGGNSLTSNLFASVAGAFMYFATLTEVPIVQGLLGSGMGKGPALALLLSGPALSLPSMLVINSILGFKKTIAYIMLVIIFSAMIGLIYGNLF
ncbi:MAG: permease [Deltaproteobacteria bacterium]|nr:permease [Deltaproteobacteria bacterium]